MTLGRTNDNKIKIKTDTPKGLRAVNCACCAPPAPCCMYPAQALLDGMYTTQDLPSEVLATYDGVYFYNMIKTGGLYPAYIAEEDPSLEIFIAEDFFSGAPAWHTLGGLPYGDCLIDGLFVKDKFAETYTITPPFENLYARPTAVSRISLCKWEGVDDCGNLVSLFYDSFFIWFITVPIYEPSGCIPNESFFDGVARLAKDESQIGRGSSPAGLYPSVDFGADFTVS